MYSIPIIPPDLRHEETIIQAAYALDCLNKTINLIFEKIDKRIEQNNVKVTDLVERIDKAQTKIKGLVGTKKAIKIYAPARFPAAHLFHDIPITFTDSTKSNENFCIPFKDYEVHNRPETTLPTIQEKLVFFHVRSQQTPANSGNDLMQIRMQAEKNIGKDKPEKEIRSVPSLLLFNTDDCVYVEENTTDEPWKLATLYKTQRQQRQQQQHIVQPKVQKQLLEPAPHSLCNRNQIRSTPAGELRYMPKLDEAPIIDLPMDLPDLPGIADDIQFEANAQQQIAPSYFSAHLPELEELEEEQEKSLKIKQTGENKSNANIPFSQSGSKTAENVLPKSNQSDLTPPPPPPPPPVPILSTPNTSLNATVNTIDASNSSSFSSAPTPPPPPPPPPPRPPSPSSSPANDQRNSLKSEAQTSSTDIHSSLMDAIRKAGGSHGALLRNISQNDGTELPQPSTAQREQPKKNYSNAPIGGDLMSDLHNKLQMRRKGISGSNANQTTDTGTGTGASKSACNTNFNPMMTRLSALIPPPPSTQTQMPAQSKQATDEDDTDWTE